MTAAAGVSSVAWIAAAGDVLQRISDTQEAAIAEASAWCADAIAGGGLVHLFGTGHSRIPVEEMFPRYGSYPGFNPIVELSMTFHTQVVGANGQRQAMFIERTPGLAEVILSNFTFGPEDVMIVFSASGLSAVPVELARGARRRGIRVIAVTSVEQSLSEEPRDRRRQPAARRGGPGHRPVHAACGRAGRDRRSRNPGRTGIHDRRRGDRQLHQGADGSAARRAGSHAARHHPSVGRRRRTLAVVVRRRLS